MGSDTPPPLEATQTPVIITATPDEPNPPTPSPGDTMTPNPETYADCFGNRIEVAFRQINGNPCLAGRHVEVPHTTADGRFQCLPDDYQYINVPGAQGVPAWIHCDDRFINGAYRPIIRQEISFVDGWYGMSQLVRFQPLSCYLVKQTGYISVNNNPLQIALRGSLVVPSDETLVIQGAPSEFTEQADRRVDLRLQGFDDAVGRYEIFWIVETGLDPPAARVEIMTAIFQAIYEGESVVETWAFEILTAPDGYCLDPSAVTW